MGKAPFSPLESATVATQIQRLIEEAIYTGQLKPGERLLEAELAEAMQVSRASFREAIRLLQSRGLVVNTHRRGTFVAELTATDVREIYTVRLLLEGYAIRHAAAHADPAFLDRLQRIVDRLQAAADQGDHYQIVELDLEFHRFICSATGNRKLLETWSGLISQVRALNLTKYRFFDDSPLIAPGHQRLLDAIRAGDPDRADEALKGHVIDTAEQVLDALAHEQSSADGEGGR